MTIDEKNKAALKEYAANMAKISVGISATLVASIAMDIACSVATTNHTKKSVTGTKIMSPTEDKTVLQSQEKNGNKTGSNLSQDEVSGQKGKVDAAETNAKASTSEATASDSGASALKTKAGATDIATKALKLN